jgi:hypothetical protein
MQLMAVQLRSLLRSLPPSAAATRKSLSTVKAHPEPPSFRFPHMTCPDSPLVPNPLYLVVSHLSSETFLVDFINSCKQLDEIPQSRPSNLDRLLVVFPGLEDLLHGLFDATQSLDVLLDL